VLCNSNRHATAASANELVLFDFTGECKDHFGVTTHAYTALSLAKHPTPRCVGTSAATCTFLSRSYNLLSGTAWIALSDVMGGGVRTRRGHTNNVGGCECCQKRLHIVVLQQRLFSRPIDAATARNTDCCVHPHLVWERFTTARAGTANKQILADLPKLQITHRCESVCGQNCA